MILEAAYYERRHVPGLSLAQHSSKSLTLEADPGKSLIAEKTGVEKAMVVSIFPQCCFLMTRRAAVHGGAAVSLPGKPAAREGTIRKYEFLDIMGEMYYCKYN